MDRKICLLISPAEYGHILISNSICVPLPYSGDYSLHLCVPARICPVICFPCYSVSSSLRYEVFGKSSEIMFDAGVCHIYDLLCTAIIDAHQDLLHAFFLKIFLKVHHYAVVSSPEAVDRLVVVTNNTEICFIPGQHIENISLDTARVLVFVYLYELIFLLPFPQHFRRCSEKVTTHSEHVFEVDPFYAFL